MEEFLIYYQEKFSDVLIPAENVAKQEFLGKGDQFLIHEMHICAKYIRSFWSCTQRKLETACQMDHC